MFGFGSKKSSPKSSRTGQVIGVELTSAKARAVSIVEGKCRTVQLSATRADLPLLVSLEQRPLQVGYPGLQLLRRRPHLVCSNSLGQLGQARQWTAGRLTVTPELAISTILETLKLPLAAESDCLAFGLPPYLTTAQVNTWHELAIKAKLAPVGTINSSLAVAAQHTIYRQPLSTHSAQRPDWVVPIRAQAGEKGALIIVDVDDHAMSATMLSIDADTVYIVKTASWPRLSLKHWADRLVDATSDRCVRLCRRDPRDSADAEQALFEQLDAALDPARQGQAILMQIRGHHWYQDVEFQVNELADFCQSLNKLASQMITDFVHTSEISLPPRAVLLTHAVDRLPGLAVRIMGELPESTDVKSLPATAVAEAVAALIPRWQNHELPEVYIDRSLTSKVAIPMNTQQQVMTRSAVSR